ncbi:MAG: hypothetical protein ACKV1O_00265 [Saprospiraceae bacterium]
MPRKTKSIKISGLNKSWNDPKLKVKTYRIEDVGKGKSFLIICEGQNTEPCYFRSIPVSNNDAFELWFLLHYQYLESQLKRQ